MAKELDKKRKQLIAESDNLQETKFQLRTSEQRCLKLTHDLSKCKQKSDEVEEKLRNGMCRLCQMVLKIFIFLTEMVIHKDLKLQIQLLEERLASKRGGRKSGRHNINSSSPMPMKMKTSEQQIPKTLSPALAPVKVKKEDLQNAEDNKALVLSAEEATDRFIAELKQDISMRITSGILSSYRLNA